MHCAVHVCTYTEKKVHTIFFPVKLECTSAYKSQLMLQNLAKKGVKLPQTPEPLIFSFWKNTTGTEPLALITLGVPQLYFWGTLGTRLNRPGGGLGTLYLSTTFNE